MARKVFLSFLGTGNYTECNYTRDSLISANKKFVQEALLELYCKDWTADDKAFIFITEEAEKINWIGNDCNGLQSKIEKMNLDLEIIPVPIPTGSKKNYTKEEIERDIWGIFTEVVKRLNNDDNLYLDITHAFRFIPMLGLVILNYSKLLYNTTIEKIFYGAFEVLGNPKDVENILIEKRNAPIVELTDFSLLQDWSLATSDFIKYGYSERVISLTRTYAKKLKGNEKQITEKFAKLLERITKIFTTLRGRKLVIARDFIELQGKTEELSKISKLPVLKSLLDLIKNKLSSFVADDILNGFRAIDWTFEHQLIQQSYTLLQEMIKTCLCHIWKNKYGFDYTNKKNRELISSVIGLKDTELEKQPDLWRGDLGDNKTIGEQVMKETLVNELSKVFKELTGLRNSMNHGGFTDTNDELMFYEKFPKYYEIILNILSKYGIVYNSSILK